MTANATKKPSAAQLKKELETTRAKLSAAEQRIAELETLLGSATGRVAA